jgi:hypothetical protein
MLEENKSWTNFNACMDDGETLRGYGTSHLRKQPNPLTAKTRYLKDRFQRYIQGRCGASRRA